MQSLGCLGPEILQDRICFLASPLVAVANCVSQRGDRIRAEIEQGGRGGRLHLLVRVTERLRQAGHGRFGPGPQIA